MDIFSPIFAAIGGEKKYVAKSSDHEEAIHVAAAWRGVYS